MNENENIKDVGFRIRRIRKDRELTQGELAKVLAIATPTLSDVENGKTKPNYDIIYGLSNSFNVNLDYLLHGRGNMYKYQEDANILSIDEKIFGEQSNDMREIVEYMRKSRIYRTILVGLAKDCLYEHRTLIAREIAGSPSMEEIKKNIENVSKPIQHKDEETKKEQQP